MPIEDPLPTDRTAGTLMGPTTHPDDHNTANFWINWCREQIEAIQDSAVPGDIRAAILDAIADGVITADAIGAMPDDADVLVLTDGRLRLADIPSDATPPPAGFSDYYSIGGKPKVQVSSGAKTELGPPFVSYRLTLATTADISTETLQTLLTSPTLATNAEYDVEVDVPYECAAYGGAIGGQLRNAFVVPAGSTGSFHGQSLAFTATGTGGSAQANFNRKDWGTPHDMGGRGAGNPTGGRIVGTLFTAATAGTFAWRVRRAATDAVTAKVYGKDNALGGASVTLRRVA